jgi:hypothetical protein
MKMKPLINGTIFDVPVWLHRACQDAWRAARDLEIPAYLERRAELPA